MKSTVAEHSEQSSPGRRTHITLTHTQAIKLLCNQRRPRSSQMNSPLDSREAGRSERKKRKNNGE